MKLKPLLLIPLLALSFACSSNDSNDNDDDDDNQDLVLIKQINYSEIEDDYSYTETFNYSGNRLMNIIDTESDSNDEYSATFQYTNDKLVRVDFLDLTELVEYVTLEYNDEGLLTSFITFFFDDNVDDVATKYNLTYDVNNSNISLDLFRGNLSSQTEFLGTIEYVISDGNILESSSDINDDTESYQYDTKNGAYKDIFEIETIILIMNSTESGFEMYGATNNVTQRNDNQNNFPSIETTEYTYNTNDYPITGMYYYDGELDSNIEFIYE
jgi:hypothetical protein